MTEKKHSFVTVNGKRYPTTHVTKAGKIAKTKKGYYIDQYGTTKKIPTPSKKK